MMRIEKQLAATDLDKYKKDELTSLLEECYKYQKFKGSVFVGKSNSKLNPTIIKNCFFSVKSYLKSHVKPKNLSHKSCEFIDNMVLTCYPILQPSEADKARPYNRKQPQTPSPTPVEKVEPPKYTEQIPPQYGVKLRDENIIRLFPSKEACVAYVDCYKEFVGVNNADVVKIDFEVV